MKLSARNQFPGTVTKVNEGAVNGIVTIDVNGTPVTSTISMAAIRELGLEPGQTAYAVVKATEVMVGLGEHLTLSARNQFPGKVLGVEKGAVNSIVRIEALGGNTISATISNMAVEELGLKPGVEALAVIKATSVMVGID
ncbi:MAG: TOBE domain-containing protein [Oscillospiraceae bacterium]|nr:TOBE domain-containing protein [Oscillospiraceae bacterium]